MPDLPSRDGVESSMDSIYHFSKCFFESYDYWREATRLMVSLDHHQRHTGQILFFEQLSLANRNSSWSIKSSERRLIRTVHVKTGKICQIYLYNVDLTPVQDTVKPNNENKILHAFLNGKLNTLPSKRSDVFKHACQVSWPVSGGWDERRRRQETMVLGQWNTTRLATQTLEIRKKGLIWRTNEARSSNNRLSPFSKHLQSNCTSSAHGSQENFSKLEHNVS